MVERAYRVSMPGRTWIECAVCDGGNVIPDGLASYACEDCDARYDGHLYLDETDRNEEET